MASIRLNLINNFGAIQTFPVHQRRRRRQIRIIRGYINNQDTINRIMSLPPQTSSNQFIDKFFNGF